MSEFCLYTNKADIPIGDRNLIVAYGCLHTGGYQITQSAAEIDFGLLGMDKIVHVNTVFLKNMPVNQRMIYVRSRNLSIHVEVYRKYLCSADKYFTKHYHHKNIDILIAYYWYGYIYDQLALLNAENLCIFDSHPGNVFVLNKKFYWGEYGISLNAIGNSNNAEEYLLGSVNKTMEMFEYFLDECCHNDTFFLVSRSFLDYVNGAMNSYVKGDNNFILKKYLEVAMTAINFQVQLFPENRQKLFYAKVGPQVNSKLNSLFEDVAKLKIKSKEAEEARKRDLRQAKEVRQRDLRQAEKVRQRDLRQAYAVSEKARKRDLRQAEKVRQRDLQHVVNSFKEELLKTTRMTDQDRKKAVLNEELMQKKVVDNSDAVKEDLCDIQLIYN